MKNKLCVRLPFKKESSCWIIYDRQFKKYVYVRFECMPFIFDTSKPLMCCFNVSACMEGYYGTDCSLRCSPNCKICQNTDGMCACKSGWMGQQCLTGSYIWYNYTFKSLQHKPLLNFHEYRIMPKIILRYTISSHFW